VSAIAAIYFFLTLKEETAILKTVPVQFLRPVEFVEDVPSIAYVGNPMRKPKKRMTRAQLVKLIEKHHQHPLFLVRKDQGGQKLKVAMKYNCTNEFGIREYKQVGKGKTWYKLAQDLDLI
jgi:hypothetical protein